MEGALIPIAKLFVMCTLPYLFGCRNSQGIEWAKAAMGDLRPWPFARRLQQLEAKFKKLLPECWVCLAGKLASSGILEVEGMVLGCGYRLRRV